jgi:Tfp pilus assembly protein FimT
MRKAKKKGFVLAELLIYVAVFAIMSVLIIGFIITVVRTFGDIKVSQSIDDSARNALERMVNEIRYSNSIDVANSTLGSNPGKLVLNTNDRSTGATTTIEFSVGNSKIRVKEGSNAYDDLTSSSTSITNLIFRRIVSTTTQEAVKIEMSVRAQNGIFDKTSKFYDTVVLRKAY